MSPGCLSGPGGGTTIDLNRMRTGNQRSVSGALVKVAAVKAEAAKEEDANPKSLSSLLPGGPNGPPGHLRLSFHRLKLRPFLRDHSTSLSLLCPLRSSSKRGRFTFTCNPVSSLTSRTTASFGVSFGSTPPPGSADLPHLSGH